MEQSLPSQLELIPNLGALDRLIHEKTPRDRRRVLKRETEQLAYYLRGACWAARHLEFARTAAVQYFDPNGIRILADDEHGEVSFALDAYLTNMRRVLDALIPYLSRCPQNISLPHSFHDFVKKLKSNRCSLDERIQELVCEYWDAVGSKIKGYRDQASHVAIISGDCLVCAGPFGAVALKLLLPDDPSEKAAANLTYQPGVPLMQFVMDSLYRTTRFVNALVERMIDLLVPNDPHARTSQIITIVPRDARLQFGPGVKHVGEPVPFSVDACTVALRAVKDELGRTEGNPTGSQVTE